MEKHGIDDVFIMWIFIVVCVFCNGIYAEVLRGVHTDSDLQRDLESFVFNESIRNCIVEKSLMLCKCEVTFQAVQQQEHLLST